MDIKPVNRALFSIANEYGEELVKQLQFELAKKEKSATGDLIDTMFHEVKSDGDGRTLVTINAESYFGFVERGRKPGTFPNLDALRKWATVKLIPERAVFPIGMKIKEEGIKGVFILNPTVKKVQDQFLPKYEQQMADLIGVVLVNDIFSSTTTKGRIIPRSLR